MADIEADLPEGTDTIIEPANVGAIATDAADLDQGGETILIDNTSLVEEKQAAAPQIPAPTGDAERPVSGSGSPQGGIADRIRNGREQLTSQAGEKARGLVSQGLDRTAETLANVSRMVGDTAAGIEERLGPEYGDYARRAAGAIENVANNIAEKDPDELIDDTRNFVRNSPGIALAGAAVVGFVVARLVKSGIGKTADAEDDRD